MVKMEPCRYCGGTGFFYSDRELDRCQCSAGDLIPRGQAVTEVNRVLENWGVSVLRDYGPSLEKALNAIPKCEGS